jgi:Universal stress protein family
MTTLTESHPALRFQSHVSFDNVKAGEATKNNPASFTLNSSHSGYQRNKRSRTFMIGVDEHSYSDYALEWLLNELVEDGDHVVCVTVIEKEVRSISEAYKAEAREKLEAIKRKSGPHRAIAITLEYAVGKLHSTFQTFVGGAPLQLGLPY